MPGLPVILDTEEACDTWMGGTTESVRTAQQNILDTIQEIFETIAYDLIIAINYALIFGGAPTTT